MPKTNNLIAPFTFSQSSLQDYTDCARRFQLRYIDHLNWPAEESAPALENEKRQKEGQFFHRLAQQAFIGLPLEKLNPLASGEHLSRWWINFTDTFFPLAEKSLAGAKLLTESSLSAPLGIQRITAKFDLIAIQDGKATIYDWKTYHKRPKNEWMSVRLQTRVYQFLVASAASHLNNGQPIAAENIQMIYWYSDFPQDPAVFQYSSAALKRDQTNLEKLSREINTIENFALTTDEKKCAYCSYRSYCNRGKSAGNWQDAEIDRETETTMEINFEQINEIEF